MFQSNKPADGQPKTETAPVATSAPAPVRGGAEPSIISADLRVVGDLHCSGELQVKGNVEGDIKSHSVNIGEGAQVQGSVMADSVHISGAIKGQIEAQAVTVARSARVQGDILHETLAVEAGAYLDGTCRRLESKPGAAAAPAKAAPPKPEIKKTAAAS